MGAFSMFKRGSKQAAEKQAAEPVKAEEPKAEPVKAEEPKAEEPVQASDNAPTQSSTNASLPFSCPERTVVNGVSMYKIQVSIGEELIDCGPVRYSNLEKLESRNITLDGHNCPKTVFALFFDWISRRITQQRQENIPLFLTAVHAQNPELVRDFFPAMIRAEWGKALDKESHLARQLNAARQRIFALEDSSADSGQEYARLHGEYNRLLGLYNDAGTEVLKLKARKIESAARKLQEATPRCEILFTHVREGIKARLRSAPALAKLELSTAPGLVPLLASAGEVRAPKSPKSPKPKFMDLRNGSDTTAKTAGEPFKAARKSHLSGVIDSADGIDDDEVVREAI